MDCPSSSRKRLRADLPDVSCPDLLQPPVSQDGAESELEGLHLHQHLQSLQSVAPPATPNALSFLAFGLSFPSVAWPFGSRSVHRDPNPAPEHLHCSSFSLLHGLVFPVSHGGAPCLHRALLVPEHPLERHNPVAFWRRGRRPSSFSSQGSRRRCCPGDGGWPRAVTTSISTASSGSFPARPALLTFHT